MTLLYCSPRVLSFLRYQRDMRLLDDELEIHMAVVKNTAHGWNKKTTYFVKGNRYNRLDKDMRAFVEKNYAEYENGIANA